MWRACGEISVHMIFFLIILVSFKKNEKKDFVNSKHNFSWSIKSLNFTVLVQKVYGKLMTIYFFLELHYFFEK